MVSSVIFFTLKDEIGTINVVERINAAAVTTLHLIAAQLADFAHHVHAVAQTFLPLRDRFAVRRPESAGLVNDVHHR